MIYYKPGHFFQFGVSNGMLSKKNYKIILILELSIILLCKIYNHHDRQLFLERKINRIKIMTIVIASRD